MSEAEFVREIKGFRFSSRLQDDRLHLTLFNLELDEFYETAYDDHSLPDSARKYFSTVVQLHFYIREKTKIFKLLAPGVVMCAQYMGRVEKFVTVEMRATGREGAGYISFLKTYCRQLVEENGAVRTQLRGREMDYQNLETENKRLRKLLEERSRDMERLKEEMEAVRNRKRNSRREKDSASKDSRDSKEKEAKEVLIKREVLPEETEQRVIVPPKRRKSRTSPRRVVKQEENTEFGPNSDQEDTPHPQDPDDAIFDEESSPVSEKLPLRKQVRELFSNGEKVVSFRVDPECRNIQRFQVEGGQFEKLQTSDTFQMYSTEPFLAEERSYFSILLEKSKYRSLTMGLITADLFEKASSSAAKGCLCYEGYYGIVIVEGKEDNRDYRKIAEGDILSALLDPISGLVEWRINLELIAKVALPEAMLHTALFPYFELEDKGDRILVNPETQ